MIQGLEATAVNKFLYTGRDVEFVVPANVCELFVSVWGASGGQGAGGAGSSPGIGAYVEGTLAVSPGQVLSVVVGGVGVNDGGTTAAFGGGGAGDGYWGGGGGGRSAIQFNGQDIVTAGGGGGSANCDGGAGSSYSNHSIAAVAYAGCGAAMQTTCHGSGGGGGSTAQGGCGGGSRYQGGSGGGYGGGGGGGYYGGGGGSHGGGGGGGGSSWLGALTGYTNSESGRIAGCNGMASRVYNPAACGGKQQNGYVVIESASRATCAPSPSPPLEPTPTLTAEPTMELTAMPSFEPVGETIETPPSVLCGKMNGENRSAPRVQSLPSTESNVLFSLFNSTNGVNWAWKTPYQSFGYPWSFDSTRIPTSDPCGANKWQGLTCYCQETCLVTRISLSAYNLVGPLPSSLFADLSSLTYLAMSKNKISDTLPVLPSHSLINYLSLSFNFLKGNYF